ncbi:hypothetical protein PR048_005257 [Dryococelus australis]|uniref:Uncharacterized protein n=1 Tax=Dryococelus australis TaxID=614101 RepID=A0ABQ9I7S4_9NEOP|nr:hypothetical protein PR048_005257 [Dryococelus australis]
MHHCSGDNPHMMTETPLHSEKLSVWCAMLSQLLVSFAHLLRGQLRPHPASNLVERDGNGAVPRFKGMVNGRYLRKPAHQEHRQARFPGEKIWSNPTGNRAPFTLIGGEGSSRCSITAPRIVLSKNVTESDHKEISNDIW